MIWAGHMCSTLASVSRACGIIKRDLGINKARPPQMTTTLLFTTKNCCFHDTSQNINILVSPSLPSSAADADADAAVAADAIVGIWDHNVLFCFPQSKTPPYDDKLLFPIHNLCLHGAQATEISTPMFIYLCILAHIRGARVPHHILLHATCHEVKITIPGLSPSLPLHRNASA